MEISGNPDYRDDFQELEMFGMPVNLSNNVQEYPESTFIPPGEVNVATLDILIWIDFPTNTIRRKLDWAHYQKTDRFQPVFSLPTEWYRFGGMFGFNPVPDKTYQVQPRILRMHPIIDDAIAETPILLSRDWNEILIWAAAQRGFMELMEYEKASAIHTLLYGDPDNKNQPGLIFHVKRKRRKEEFRSEGRLTVMKRPYMWGHP